MSFVFAALPMVAAVQAVPQQQEPAEPEQDAEEVLLPGRRRPGVPQRELEEAVTQDNPGAIRAPPPEAFPTDQIPVPDRWRLIESLGLVRERWFDPYNQNTLKGDRPICIRAPRKRKKGGRRASRAVGRRNSSG
jgi:hypothetical protein